MPTQYELLQNYPNPFNPSTKINFAIPKSSRVSIVIFDIRGNEIRSLVSEQFDPGIHSVNWEALDNNGNAVASGIYLYRIRAEDFSAVKKMVLLH
jgi:flagellar hook assembly protein FlgD